MRYEQFRAWRTGLLRTRSPRRLDCMNPEVALAHLRPAVEPAPDVPAPTTATPEAIDAVLARWSRAAAVELAEEERVVGTGIRPLLAGLFAAAARHLDTLWLPDDVYPVYWELSAHLPRRGFATLPEPDWRALDEAGPRDALLLPHPLSPAGRALTPGELTRLSAWLEAHPGRLLLLDRAYDFALEPDYSLGERALSLWSLSKPWLSRGLLGVARVPAALRAEVQAAVELPSPSELARAGALLEAAPRLPARVSERFRKAWDGLAPALTRACPSWRPPLTGYFSIVPASYEELLAQHDLLAVPASVFGSRRADLSIASCLYEIELADGRAR